MSRYPSTAERIAARVVVAASGCHEWSGPRSRNGYGTTWFNGAKRGVHRVVWILANGPIPDDLQVMHACDNRLCCNVAHLSLGTAADNQADKAKKGRARNQNAGKTHCPKRHPYSPENTYINPRGARECRICKSASRSTRKAAA
ncbi:MAG TPA: HNH endonuclease signature motif containing protein [Solirubrobacteraceae bacterium]|nr:HNH endonuclease signature motif containing protein [Solirubrobacteraceae bacterium]